VIKQVYNPLSTQQADYIEQQVSDKFFPWYYFGNVHAVESKSSVTYGFQHTALEYGKDNSSLCETAKLIAYAVANSAGITIDSIYHLRFNLLTIQSNDIEPHFHTDLTSEFYEQNPHLGKHYSAIYYINNSDGCTLFEGQKTTIKPIKNTGVVFDGTMMHSASYPMSNQIRLVLNINFFSNEQ
jgi:hypothetical protein